MYSKAIENYARTKLTIRLYTFEFFYTNSRKRVATSLTNRLKISKMDNVWKSVTSRSPCYALGCRTTTHWSVRKLGLDSYASNKATERQASSRGFMIRTWYEHDIIRQSLLRTKHWEFISARQSGRQKHSKFVTMKQLEES